MKTTQEKIEDIRRVCIKANPEIVEYKEPEEWWIKKIEIVDIVKNTIGDAYQKRFNKNVDYDQWVGIRDHMEDCARQIFGKIEDMLSLNKEAIGRPIRLADVLLAIRKQESIQAYTRAVSKLLFTNHKSEHFSSNQDKKEWSFSKNSLTEQSEETINFVHLLLCNK